MIVFLLATALLSLVLTGLATLYAGRRGLIDLPGERHSHREATPRGGGAGPVLALALASLLPGDFMPQAWFPVILPGFLLMAVLGAWDDHRSLSARVRFAVQLLACALLAWSLPLSGPLPAPLLWFVAVLFAAWMVNLFNFMDGSNGMAGTQGVFAAAVLAWLFGRAGANDFAWLSALTAACCLGFLPWNLGRARVFMGDVGSLALGFLFSALLLHGIASGAFSLPVGLMVMALFLADATLTLLRRVMRGERWYNAHRQHLYQRIIALGWTHGRVLLLYQVINLALVLPGIVFGVNHPGLAWPIATALAVVLVLGWYLSIKRIGALAAAR